MTRLQARLYIDFMSGAWGALQMGGMMTIYQADLAGRNAARAAFKGWDRKAGRTAEVAAWKGLASLEESIDGATVADDWLVASQLLAAARESYICMAAELFESDYISF